METDDEAAIIWHLIDKLRNKGVVGVSLCNTNSSFKWLPNEIVEVRADWTDWQPRLYPGNTVRDCLERALKDSPNGESHEPG